MRMMLPPRVSFLNSTVRVGVKTSLMLPALVWAVVWICGFIFRL